MSPSDQTQPEPSALLRLKLTIAANDLLTRQNVIGVSAEDVVESVWSALSECVLIDPSHVHSELSSARAANERLRESLTECVVSIEHRASREEMECTVERARLALKAK